jgi:hypothetical protein
VGLRDLSSSCGSIGLGPTHRRRAGIARLVWEQQTRIQSAVTDARCRPLTLLLGFIEAIEVAFPRDAPRIFLGVSSLCRQGSKDSHDRCDRGKGRKAYHLDSDHELGYARPPLVGRLRLESGYSRTCRSGNSSVCSERQDVFTEGPATFGIGRLLSVIMKRVLACTAEIRSP